MFILLSLQQQELLCEHAWRQQPRQAYRRHLQARRQREGHHGRHEDRDDR